MNLQLNLNYVYFSATGYTKVIIREIGESLLQEYSATIGNEKKWAINIKNSITNNKEDRKETLEYDFTLPANRTNKLTFTSKDLVIVGVPVYAGRVPNLLLPFINSIEGNGATAIAVVTFGNRAFDDALSVPGVCIKCSACVKQCPIGAKYFNNKDYEYHVEWLIRECGCREAKNFIFY